MYLVSQSGYVWVSSNSINIVEKSPIVAFLYSVAVLLFARNKTSSCTTGICIILIVCIQQACL